MDTGEYRSLFICKWVSIGGIILCAYAGYQDIVLGLNRSGSMSTGPNSFSAIIALAAPFVLLNIPNLLINIVNWLIFWSGIVIVSPEAHFWRWPLFH